MIKKIILTSFFSVAIVCGMAFGYGATKVLKTSYAMAQESVSPVVSGFLSEYISKIKFIKEDNVSMGGPAAVEIIETNFNRDTEHSDKSFEIKKNKKSPQISALSYLVADLETGKVLASQNINDQLPIASVTKLMTAIVADESLGLDTQTTLQSEAINTYGTQGELKKGEKYTVAELFYPLLLESSNDAAEALAQVKDRESFIQDMNSKASSIGLLNTYYDDASGLSSENTSTVTDLFRLAQYISKYRNYIFDISTQLTKEIRGKTWLNNSRFRSDKNYVGGKNGFTDEAQKTQLVLFKENFSGEERIITYIILHSSDVGADIKNLRNFVHKNVAYK